MDKEKLKLLYNFIIKLKLIALLICSNFSYAEELITNNSFLTANYIEHHNDSCEFNCTYKNVMWLKD